MPRDGLTQSERTLRAQVAAHTSWAKTADRTARTAKARKGLEQRFLDEADGDPKRAESLRQAFYKRMAFRSAQSRRRKGVVESRIAELDGGGDHAA